jgi:general secretion pathway protein G
MQLQARAGLAIVCSLTLGGCLSSPLHAPLSSSDQVNDAKRFAVVIAHALDTYRLDVGEYPSSLQGLDALISKPPNGKGAKPWKGPYLYDVGSVPLDPWGHPFQYLADRNALSYRLISLGADGVQRGVGYDADLVIIGSISRGVTQMFSDPPPARL